MTFDMNTYHELAMRTGSSKQSFKERCDNALYGLIGEFGEVADVLKKHFYHGHDLAAYDLALELGDVQWYITLLADAAGVPLSEVMRLNIEKLKKRYPEGFTYEASLNRDAV